MKYFCLVKAARWDERKPVPFLGKSDLVIPSCSAQQAWSDTEAVESFCWGNPTESTCFTVSDTDHPFLQRGGCQHRVRHCYRQTKGQVELHKSILDTNSCKYLVEAVVSCSYPLCCPKVTGRPFLSMSLSTWLTFLVTGEEQVESAEKLMLQEWPATTALWALVDKHPSICTPQWGSSEVYSTQNFRRPSPSYP